MLKLFNPVRLGRAMVSHYAYKAIRRSAGKIEKERIMPDKMAYDISENINREIKEAMFYA